MCDLDEEELPLETEEYILPDSVIEDEESRCSVSSTAHSHISVSSSSSTISEPTEDPIGVETGVEKENEEGKPLIANIK